jgi:oxygen-independent coproporphyrinogen-3 oxidase
MDPGTFDGARLDAYLACGVTRVSLGVQSWAPQELAAAGRAHCVADADAACRLLGEAYAQGRLQSWSLDLISGLPHATAHSWQHTLDRTVGRSSGAVKPPHVSVYDLQVLAGTCREWDSKKDATGTPLSISESNPKP